MPAPVLSATEAAALLEPLTGIVRAAGRAILDVPRTGLMTVKKTDGSPLTQADRNADQIIVDGLTRLAPGIPVVSEERAAPDVPLDGSFFMIDPLDGTREFVAGRDEYSVNIALVTNGEPVLGVIGAPALHTVWRGHAGHAEKLAGDAAAAVPIRSRAFNPGDCVAMVSRSHLDMQTAAFVAGHSARHEPMGSALKFCRIAEGKADIYPRLAQTCEWDVAAGYALVAASGGRVTDGDGGTLRFGNRAAQFRIPSFIVWGDRNRK